MLKKMKITTTKELRELYDFPAGRAKDKQFSELDKYAIHFIKKSPFLILSSCGKNRTMDTSPRGGKPGFTKIINTTQLVIPDSKGNNRMDSIINIIETNRIGLLFLIPGIEETFRINGNAYLTTDEKYLDLFSSEKKIPKSCIVVNVEEMFLHCAKALMRSKLWNEDYKLQRIDFPTMGEMLKDQLNISEKPETYEEMVKRYSKDLYFFFQGDTNKNDFI